MEAELTEDALIIQAIAGDQAALERLMLRHHGRLLADLDRRMPAAVRGFVAVDDVMQETYVVVFREIRKFQPRAPGAFFSWISRIALSRLYDAVKAETAAKRGGEHARARPPTHPDTGSVVEWLEALATHERTPSRSAVRREAAAAIRAAMDDLGTDQREALRLRYLEGLPVAQAAARMNRTEGAVCLLCHRGLQRLRETLSSSPFDLTSRA